MLSLNTATSVPTPYHSSHIWFSKPYHAFIVSCYYSYRKILLVKNFLQRKKDFLFRKSFSNAGDRNRTGTECYLRRILSPVRLPVPPLRRQATPRFELGVKDLQSSALPLGYVAVLRFAPVRYNDINYMR